MLQSFEGAAVAVAFDSRRSMVLFARAGWPAG